MAKKILYKTKAYHCPRCGGITEPTKKYCEFCERDLAIRSESKYKGMIRILIDCGNYVFFDSIRKFEPIEHAHEIDCTCLEDTRRTVIRSVPDYEFRIWMPTTERTAELMKLPYSGIKNVRVEIPYNDVSFEMQSYVSNVDVQMWSTNIMMETQLHFICTSEPKQGRSVPEEIMKEMRCPNCGAPIKSRYGACDYCSGWSEIEW